MEVSPWVVALRDEASLPWAVRGPVARAVAAAEDMVMLESFRLKMERRRGLLRSDAFSISKVAGRGGAMNSVQKVSILNLLKIREI